MGVLMPMIRKVLPGIIANEICGVQPMINVEHPGRAEAVKDHFERLFKKYSSFDIEAEITAALSADLVNDNGNIDDLDVDIYITPPQAVEFIEVPIRVGEAANEAQMEKVEVKPFTIHLPGIVKAERPRAFTASEQPSALQGES